jgi:hypothetical protein
MSRSAVQPKWFFVLLAQQLNSSTAQQLNSSTAQQLNSSTAQQLNSSNQFG